MSYTAADLDLAQRHVRDADVRILRQRALIGRLTARSQPTGLARDLLGTLQDTLAQMHDHVVAIQADLDQQAPWRN